MLTGKKFNANQTTQDIFPSHTHLGGLFARTLLKTERA
jgi:hypothetical protein